MKKMIKTLIGLIVSTKMQNTVIVEVTTQKPHPLYRKLLKRTKRFKADLNGQTVALGDRVKITEIRPMSADKYFKVSGIVRAGEVSKKKESVK